MKIFMIIFLAIAVCVGNTCNGIGKKGRGGKKQQPTRQQQNIQNLESQLEEEKNKNKRLASQLEEVTEQRKQLCKTLQNTEEFAEMHKKIAENVMRQLLEKELLNGQLKEENKLIQAEKREIGQELRVSLFRLGQEVVARKSLENKQQKGGKRK